MIPIFYIKEQGQRGCCPFPLHPKSPPTQPPLRCGLSRLTIPNTYFTITIPASLRSDCCSPSLRNAVRLPSGIDVRLHRNTHNTSESFLGGGGGGGIVIPFRTIGLFSSSSSICTNWYHVFTGNASGLFLSTIQAHASPSVASSSTLRTRRSSTQSFQRCRFLVTLRFKGLREEAVKPFWGTRRGHRNRVLCPGQNWDPDSFAEDGTTQFKSEEKTEGTGRIRGTPNF